MTEELKKTYCSFCGKSEDESEIIITSENGSAICSKCVDLCRDIVGSHRVKKKEGTKLEYVDK